MNIIIMCTRTYYNAFYPTNWFFFFFLNYWCSPKAKPVYTPTDCRLDGDSIFYLYI